MHSAIMSTENSTALRLKAIREEAHVSVREMARRVSWSPSTYAHYENPDRFKDRFLNFEQASLFARALHPEGMSERVMALTGPQAQGAAPAEIDRVETGEEPYDGKALVPVYDVQASAGHGAFVEYESEAYGLAFPPEYLKKLTKSSRKNLAIISVKGESMEPTLIDDDIVLLDMSKRNLSFDGLFVLSFDDTLHVKRVGRSAKRGYVTIISDHPKYLPIERAVEETDVVGRVLWYGRKV